MADEAPEQIIINGQEYTPEEADQFITLGKRAKQIETDLNTSLDKVYPEYTKASQRVKGLEQELAETNTRLADLQAKKTEKVALPEDAEAIRANAKKYGLLTEDAATEKGYMTRDEVDKYLEKRDTNRQLLDNLNKQGDKLEQEIDGSDGRVPFVYKAVLAYAANYKIEDLKDAYEEMNERANARWKQEQLAKEERKGLQTLKSGGKSKEPERPKVTDDNFNQMWDELLTGSE